MAQRIMNRFFLLYMFLAVLLCAQAALAGPVLSAAPPQRVVSLVPVVTEIIFAIEADDVLAGITHHSTFPAGTANKEVAGGFFSPSLDAIEALNPDLIFVTDLHKDVKKRFSNKCRLVQLPVHSIEEAFERILTLGRMFGRESQAQTVVDRNRAQLELIAQKVAKIPDAGRKRMLRLMGEERLMVPGDDSFQLDFVRAAGGIPSSLGKKGNVVEANPVDIAEFDPQVMYACGKSRTLPILQEHALEKVSAITERNLFFFPCDMTCRAGANIGSFVSWLSAKTYGKEFSKADQQVIKDRIEDRRSLDLPVEYVDKAEIVYSRVRDFTSKTLLIDFKRPQMTLSTLEGMRSGVETAGNHYFPAPTWGLGHEEGLDGLKRLTYAVLDKQPQTTSLLYTGADMDNISVQQKQFKDMKVFALVTAGVKHNALRMSQDNGNFYEPGTINIVLLSNTQLSPRAMTRAMISATEGKTAALSDLDIRSSYQPQFQATGTGTDNILVVQGEGTAIDNCGGHTKMGELVSKAVYDGVIEAIAKQNGITRERSIFARLKERRLSLWKLLPKEIENCSLTKGDLIRELEAVMLKPEYAGFLAGALAMSDDEQAGIISDFKGFALWGRKISAQLAGKGVDPWQHHFKQDQVEPVVALAFEALINGVCAKEQ